MTTAVDPHLIAEINTLRPSCEVITHADQRPCGDAGAWLITWVPALTYGPPALPKPWCDEHLRALGAHRAVCGWCRDTWRITAVRL